MRFGYLFLLFSFLLVGCPQDPRRKCSLAVDCFPGESCFQGFCTAANNSCTPGTSRPCYTGADGTKGKGLCREGTEPCSTNGTWSGECKDQIIPQQEICDSKDNDCDGQIDNVSATPEVCDGVDNDCDGKVDNLTGTDNPINRTCYTGNPDTNGRGACRGGNQVCKNGKWDTCVGEIVPKPEVCNNQQDDDCDGIVDNVPDLGKPCTDPTKTGACQQGVYDCNAQGQRICKAALLPKNEDCNGVDDDCDGFTDNAVVGKADPLTRPCPYSGPPGTEGIGECKAGVQACNNGQWSATCINQIVPTPEVCDGKDNDCDGKVDNQAGTNQPLAQKCYNGPEGTLGKGECREGNQSCNNGKWADCQGSINPVDELCANNKDEDCDGRVDNVRFLGENCLEPSRKGNCQRGVYQCQGPNRVCSQSFQPATELCNGQDDDCDGTVDNKPGSSDPLTRDCYLGDAATRKKGVCRDGTQTCQGGVWSPVCKGETIPSPELCNGLDDNCNGQVDETAACAACTDGQSRDCYNAPSVTRGRGSCKDGKENCLSGKWSGQCNNAVVPAPEDCNAQDDDCDGLVDNQAGTRLPLRRPCYNGPQGTQNKGLCSGGFQSCVQGAWQTTCEGEVVPQAEICDGKDNNCDGQIDETPACQTKERKLHEICSTDQADPPGLRCAFGLTCIQASELEPKSFCYYPCTGPASCANLPGLNGCAPLSDTVSICISQADDGLPCDIEQSRFCKPDLICDPVSRRCRPPSSAPTLGACGPITGFTCDPKDRCTVLTPGAPNGYCLPRCNNLPDCVAGSFCLNAGGTDGVCMPIGQKQRNQVCGRADKGGPTLDTSVLCAANMVCVRLASTNPDGICQPVNTTLCNFPDPCQNFPGTTCVEYLGLSVCMRACNPGACAADQDCVSYNFKAICFAKPPPGTLPFGSICNAYNRCDNNLDCQVAFPVTQLNGFCTKTCVSTTDCPQTPTGAACEVLVQGGQQKTCIFRCVRDTDCPRGLVCNPGLGSCIAPN